MAIKHAKGRHQFGKPLAALQSTQFKIAEMAAKIEVARNTVYKAAWLIDQGKANPTLTAMAKLVACHTAVEVVDESFQIHGGYAYFNDYPIERFYRAAKVLELYEAPRKWKRLLSPGKFWENIRCGMALLSGHLLQGPSAQSRYAIST